jgi:hypothetical protein
MSANVPAIDDGYRRYVELLLQHRHLLSQGRDESPETEAVGDEMAGLWERLDEAQRRSLAGLGSDLRWVRRGCHLPPKSWRPEEVTSGELQALAQAEKENDWHGLLHYLRLCSPRIPPARLASLRASVWAALQFPQLASRFGDLIAVLATGSASVTGSERRPAP